MSNGMWWKQVSEFNPNDYKKDDVFVLFLNKETSDYYGVNLCFTSLNVRNDEGKDYIMFWDLYNNDIRLSIKDITHFMKLEQPEGDRP